ncbi:uncharacterized protein SPPG_07378 [Spizellomyces punctatus DAOM BR117]|uniref:BTB domain-containing protein n=1 Tax=Spizellomyces punctatus (strain DAOM BR117) TaxID=645134 RepID=A0A0L0H7E1_SPIPD|nr:uncharacterized protein SPPG_07378 [Spizellomyces punctatus DAOM BR117]KNC97460.1 hypothetical protein SPPG_07378 [Spizellomyces punctatus DAOM BR117]|eukprot:XP_016605500.1 hypothetical protein SPPG_07378 [Spizellomyces punctatus DAOM BR117]
MISEERLMLTDPELLPDARSVPIHSKPKEPRPTSARSEAGSTRRADIGRDLQRNVTVEASQTDKKAGQCAFRNMAGSDIVIHVYDENRNAKRDFFCKRSLLIGQMSYFSSYLYDRTAEENVEIDVHCDVEVFEWLMAYITRRKPAFEARTAISILISSNFLQMSALEDQCLKYVHDHINEILKVPIDMGCLSNILLRKLASLFSVDELSTITDPRDKILSQLYFTKLSEMLSSATGNVIRRCIQCGKPYARKQEANLRCRRASLTLDTHGRLHSLHERDPQFDINEYIAGLHAGGLSWKEVYWRIWGTLNHQHCTTCDEIFACVDYTTCARHTSIVSFPPGEALKGYYPCCGAQELKFNPFQLPKGCRQFTHTPSSMSHEINGIFRSHMAYIIRPPGPTAENDPPSQCVAAAVENDSIAGSEKRVSSMVNTFVDVFSVWKPPVQVWDFKRFNSKEQLLTANPNASNLSSSGTVHGSDSRIFAVPLVNRKSQHAQRTEDTARLYAMIKQGRLTCRKNLG